MGLLVSTDPATVRDLAQRFLARDPVRGTILGSIAAMAGDGAWAASDSDRLAIRSDSPHPLLLVGSWSPDAVAELLPILREVDDLAGLSGAAQAVGAVRDGLDREVHGGHDEQLFRCDVLLPPDDVDGVAELAGESHFDLVRDWTAAFMTEAEMGFGDAASSARRALGTGCWLWRAPTGELASMAVRQAVHAGSARIGPVYTPPTMRGHGYGSAVTAAATRDVIADDAIPVLFTDLANPTSNKIYRQLGYEPVEQRLSVAFV